MVACSSLTNVQRKTLPDGSYELSCRTRLSVCLMDFQDTCAEAGYDVVDAAEELKRVGPDSAPAEIVRSRATVRCRRPAALFFSAGSAEPGALPAPAPSASAAPPRTICSPGATQVCVGTAACQGGQRCLPDGSGFGPCDCGPAPAPAIQAENPAPPASVSSPTESPAPAPAPAVSAPKTPGP